MTASRPTISWWNDLAGAKIELPPRLKAIQPSLLRAAAGTAAADRNAA